MKEFKKSQSYFVLFAKTYIIACILISIFAYLIINDKSKLVNTQIPERPLLSLGHYECFEQSFVESNHKQSLISKYFFGNVTIEKLKPLNEFNQQSIQTCKTFWFGTDKYGRDLFSRVVVGLRYTLFVSFISVLLAMLIGVILGSLAGYFGSYIDQFISMLISIFWSIPSILLAFAILLAFGRNMVSIFFAIALTIWGDIARLVRGLVMQLKEREFVLACKALGMSNLSIIFKHIFPNLLSPLWVSFSTNFALAVLLESGLSFLGLGLQPPTPTLGNILQEQYAYIITGKPMHAIIPAIVVVLLILSFQIITNYLRDKSDINLNMVE